MRHICVLLTWSLVLLAFACSPKDPNAPIPPPPIVLGEDPCAACSMIISDQRYAGAIGLREDGRIKNFVFCDIGEMFDFKLPSAGEARYFVHDHDTAACIDAQSAFYLRSKRLRTPMHTGVAAFASAAERDAAREEFSGTSLSIGDLLQSP